MDMHLTTELATLLRDHGYAAYVGPLYPDTGLLVGHESSTLIVDIKLDVPWQERMLLATSVQGVLTRTGRYTGVSISTNMSLPGYVKIYCTL